MPDTPNPDMMQSVTKSLSTPLSINIDNTNDAIRDKMDALKDLDFVNKIKYEDLEIGGYVDHGRFGVVRRGKYKDENVAVKVIEGTDEIDAFLVEVRTLSRVSHPNIVQLYGACLEPHICLVMELADGGSLYKVLHHMRDTVHYTSGHAVSWLRQCISGVAYLHNMKPRALVHRDLKPPNMLLVNGGTVLKICDFGTACDVHTQMTHTKGSIAWMAPEVFKTNNYTEMCDMYSFGIIIWEVLSRKRPFEDLKPQFRIMWEVDGGLRPPRLTGIPRVLDTLMTSCWSADVTKRPTAQQALGMLNDLYNHLDGAGDIPLSQVAATDNSALPARGETPTPRTMTPGASADAGASPASSNQLTPGGSTTVKRGHRRTGSAGATICPTPPHRKTSLPPPPLQTAVEDLDLSAHLFISPRYQPLTPAWDVPESIELYEEHRKLAQRYFRDKTELEILRKRCAEIDKELAQVSAIEPRKSWTEELMSLESDRKGLEDFRDSNKRKLMALRKLRYPPGHMTSDEWVLL